MLMVIKMMMKMTRAMMIMMMMMGAPLSRDLEGVLYKFSLID